MRRLFGGLAVCAAVLTPVALLAAPASAATCSGFNTGQYCHFEDIAGQSLTYTVDNGSQYTAGGLPESEIHGIVDGTVSGRDCTPFSDCRFDSLYNGASIITLQVSGNTGGGCVMTDAVHSGVIGDICTVNDINAQWVIIGGGLGGNCQDGGTSLWYVNVGETNHYNTYPYGIAMYVNTNNYVYVKNNESAADGDDQWCWHT